MAEVQIPRPDHAVLSASGQSLPVRAERHCINSAVRAGEGLASCAGCAGLVMFHSHTLSSALPAARVRPSGLNATELTKLAGPVRGWPSCAGCAGLVMFHSRTLSSSAAGGQGPPVRAERHRVDEVGGAGEGLA